jgi:hypothetical protein
MVVAEEVPVSVKVLKYKAVCIEAEEDPMNPVTPVKMIAEIAKVADVITTVTTRNSRSMSA